MFFLFVPVCLGDVLYYERGRVDFVFKPGYLGQYDVNYTTILINPTATTDLKGHLFIPLKELPAERPGVPSPRFVVTKYYELYVDVDKEVYHRGKDAIANITIVYKDDYYRRVFGQGRFSKNHTLRMYLLDPHGRNYSLTDETLPFLPLTCEKGRYDTHKKVCIQYGKEYPATPFKIQRGLLIPHKTEIGDWQFIVEFDPHVVPTLKVGDIFEVKRNYLPFWIIFAILALAKIRQRKRRRREEEKQRRRGGPGQEYWENRGWENDQSGYYYRY